MDIGALPTGTVLYGNLPIKYCLVFVIVMKVLHISQITKLKAIAVNCLFIRNLGPATSSEVTDCNLVHLQK